MRDRQNNEMDFYIDDHAVLFGLIAKFSEETLGDRGLETCRQGVIIMARERGLRSAKRCLANGDELTIKSYLCYAELFDSKGWNQVEINAYAPIYQTSTIRCGWYDTWKKYGFEKYSLIYCAGIDKNILYGFNPQLQRGLRMVYHHKKIDRKLFEKYRRRFSPYCSVASLYLWAVAGGAVENMRDYAPKRKRVTAH